MEGRLKDISIRCENSKEFYDVQVKLHSLGYIWRSKARIFKGENIRFPIIISNNYFGDEGSNILGYACLDFYEGPVRMVSAFIFLRSSKLEKINKVRFQSGLV